jgi:hypothetical protein
MRIDARPLLAGLALALVAVGVAPAAQPTDGSMRVNEVYPAGPGEAFVELLDVLPGGEDPPYDSYSVISYDADGAEVASQEFTKPFPFASRTTPFVFGDGGDAPALPLASGAGRVCFKVTTLTDPIHCLKYANVPAGQSVQRQRCGRAGTAAPTRGQENAVLDAVCAGRRPCDDPRFTFPGILKMKVIGKKFQDVDRFALKFLLNKDGDFSTRGSYLITDPAHPRIPTPRDSLIWGPIRREVKAGVPTRVKIPITARFKRTVKRALRQGKLVRAFAVSVGRDNNCNPQRFHSSRAYELFD